MIALRQTTGLVCPNCRKDVVITQRVAVLAGFTLLVLGAICMVALAKFIEDVRGVEFSKVAEAIFVITGIGAVLWLNERITPLFLRVRKAKPLEEIFFPK
ncbi:MAG TPA: hypothetical protein VFO31_12870 [Vicinamibacterales bacterium]|nr:hypothetical protein [Vicinamibacterales bacterium]